LIDELEAACEDVNLGEMCTVVINQSGLLDFHKQEKGERGQVREENLQELVSACRAFEPEDEETTVVDAFLDRAALDAGESQADEFEEAVQMMSITRAMQKLVLTYAESRRMYGKESFNTVSRFVREIPNEYITEVRMKKAVTRPGTFQQQSMEDTGTGWRLGQTVRHSKYGEGVILQVVGQGARACVEINFASAGNKMIMLQYASLEAV